jgi:hypothetical protein
MASRETAMGYGAMWREANTGNWNHAALAAL